MVLLGHDLILEPLAVGHAQAMFEVLSEPALYRYLDEAPPPCVEDLRRRYLRLEQRRSPDGSQLWLNWIVRPHGHPPVGYVQATVETNHTAWVAYVFASRVWGRGFATQATHLMIEHLASAWGVVRYRAIAEAENQRSIRVLERLGFHAGIGQDLDGQRLSPTEILFLKEGGSSHKDGRELRGNSGIA